MHTFTQHLRSSTVVGILALLAVLVTACGGGNDPTVSPPDGAALNEADIAFLQGMIPHHAQAVAMAQMVEGRTQRSELLELADTIISTQEAEIEEMTALLEEAGAEVPDPGMTGMEGMDMEGMSMSGMMSSEQMQAMMDAEGAAFEAMFLESMIAHHRGAIEAAEQALEEGSSPEVAALAEDIIAAQQAEIEQMTAWQQEWGV